MKVSVFRMRGPWWKGFDATLNNGFEDGQSARVWFAVLGPIGIWISWKKDQP